MSETTSSPPVRDATEPATQPTVCDCAAKAKDGAEPHEHAQTCPSWEPYFPFVWCWLWNFPNHRTELRKSLRKEDVESARKALALATAYRWAYSPHAHSVDARDLQHGDWMDKALCDNLSKARADAKRIWRRWKEQGALPESIPSNFIWDQGFLGLGVVESIPELETD